MSKQRYWTTLEDLHRDPAVEKLRGEEFKGKPEEFFEAADKDAAKLSFGRRDFMKWSAGALALATTACTRKPAEPIIPYAQQPPELTPGVANYYASTCRECAAGCGILVRTREGRPIKAEGNLLHPVNRGALCARGQAALLNLYDPDRLRDPMQLNRGYAGVRVQVTPQQVGSAMVPIDVWSTGEQRTPRETIKVPMQRLSWAEADSRLLAALSQPGTRTVLLTGTIHGPARTAVVAEFLKTFKARQVVYDSLNPDALVAGQQAAYGTAVVPRFYFDRVETLVTLGADPLGEGISRVEYERGFGQQRKLRGQTMSKVVAFEPAMSLTGMNADDRYLVRPEDLLPIALGLAHQLVVVGKLSTFAGNAAVLKALAPFAPAAVESHAGLPHGTLARVANSLWQQRGKGLVYATGMAGATADQASLELVAAFLNAALQNEGATVDGTVSPSLQAQGSNATMLALVDDLRANKVDNLIIYGANPAYSLPAAAGFQEALAKVPFVATFGDRLDETALLSNLALPTLHGMESWGDAEPLVGVFSLVQPTIAPLFNARGFEDSLIALARSGGSKAFEIAPAAAVPVPAGAAAPAAGQQSAGQQAAGQQAAGQQAAAPPPPPAAPKPMKFYDFLRATWQTQIYAKSNLAGTFDDFWAGALRAGVFDPNSAQRLAPGKPRAFKGNFTGLPAALPAPSGAGLALVLSVPPMLGDGRVNNNAFLLEVPDPVAKIVWDNFAALAPKTAARLGLAKGDLVNIAVNGTELKNVPVHLQPGIHPEVVTVAVGYGREAVGQVGSGIGVNAYPAAQILNTAVVYSGAPVRLEKAGSGYILVSPQEHAYLDGRDDKIMDEGSRADDVIHETTLVQINTNPKAGNPPAPAPQSLWDNGGPSEHVYSGYRWGMTIDLNACSGCNACVVACYQENNIPVVGKDQQWRGREMSWLRIDRYYSSEDDANPDVVNLPMLCQQCGHAGCESVCPVLATVTNEEGLNTQVYNRCVGTRFCSNNCIYKVRRFNFYEYSKVRSSPLELALNPDVTVRWRGIMEKCTFCVQRITAAHYHSKALGVPIADGSFETACQQTCPSRAISFGNMNDPHAKVMKDRGARAYGVLEAFNFKPSIQYLTKVRNVEKQEEEA